MANFWRFLRPVFSASRMQHVSDLYPKFALRPRGIHTMCGSVVDIQSATAEIRRGKKIERRKKKKKKPQDKNIMSASATEGGHNNWKLECGPMPNVMAAMPNIGGAFCSTPQSLADAHY